MIPAQNTLLTVLFLGVCTSVLLSCSGHGFFKTPAGQDKTLSPPGAPKDTKDLDLEAVHGEMDPLNQTISDLEDKILALENKITSIEDQLSGPRSTPGRADPIDPEPLYQNARGFLKEKKFVQAAEMFHVFVLEHPRHSLADNAMYWLGECHYASGQYEKAIEVFKELVVTYPRAGKVPDALLKIGYAYLSLDDTNQARDFLKRLLKNYPFSSAAEKAQKKLKKLE